MGMGADIKVSQFIQNEGWNLPTPTSNNLMDIVEIIPAEIQPWVKFEDEIVWTLEDQGKFTLKSSYNYICNLSSQHL